MSIRLNVNDLHALARQFRYSHEQISDLMRLLNRHLQVLLSSVTTAKTSDIDQSQTEMEHELKGYLHTLDDLEHLLSHTEVQMMKTDQMLAEMLYQCGGYLADYPPIMSFLASKCPTVGFTLTASLLSEPLALLKQLRENGLSGLFLRGRVLYFQLDEQGRNQLWAVRRLLSSSITDNMCLLAYNQTVGGSLSRTVLAFASIKTKAAASDVKRFPISRRHGGHLQREDTTKP
ncbi:hypothetical protein [Bacillus sonorensis]|uniref:hypothetical protein n=1 Tax=Bacillus sonorensis TaxID=119858 RepID=UPI00227EEF56|nr:hypothetical protein [Bacillus sonorensis]MCY8271920.1 hypothetical protein [Bacillus sonorensis]MCY8605686.1 hypothetical protein [Bacillus sonorensis]